MKKNDYYYYEYVALKTIGHAESKDFLNEVIFFYLLTVNVSNLIFISYFQAKGLQRWGYQSPIWATLYGFTKNESTGQYFLVLRYFKDGDLRKQTQGQIHTWKKKIEIIHQIAYDVKNIHQAGMIHR